MQTPRPEPSRAPRHVVDRMMTVAFIGGLVALAGLFGLFSLYMGRMSEATSGMHRADKLPTYEGRPSKKKGDGPKAMDFLLVAVDTHGQLAWAGVAHLSGNRQQVHLVGLPSGLIVQDSDGQATTLRAAFAKDEDMLVQVVEKLFQLPVDHRLRVDLSAFTRCADALSGVEVVHRAGDTPGTWPQGPLDLDSDLMKRYLDPELPDLTVLERSLNVVRAVIGRLVSLRPFDDPHFDPLVEALNASVVVDADLTPSEIRQIGMQLKVEDSDVVAVPPPLASVSHAGEHQVEALDHKRLTALVSAFAHDDLSGYLDRHPVSWDALPSPPQR